MDWADFMTTLEEILLTEIEDHFPVGELLTCSQLKCYQSPSLSPIENVWQNWKIKVFFGTVSACMNDPNISVVRNIGTDAMSNPNTKTKTHPRFNQISAMWSKVSHRALPRPQRKLRCEFLMKSQHTQKHKHTKAHPYAASWPLLNYSAWCRKPVSKWPHLSWV